MLKLPLEDYSYSKWKHLRLSVISRYTTATFTPLFAVHPHINSTSMAVPLMVEMV